MDKILFNDYVKKYDVEKELIDKYDPMLPNELISLWKEYGMGSFYNGYFKLINPDEFQELLNVSYYNGNKSIPVMATAFGDLIVWQEGKYLTCVNYRYNDNNIMTLGFEDFNDTVLDEEEAQEYYSFDAYQEALSKYGELEYDECFGYVPLLALGGKEHVDNIKKVKLKEHIALITDMVGEV